SGEERLVEEVAGRRFELGPGSFFQANPDQAEALVALVREHFGEVHGRLVDFYAGVGLFSLTAAAADAEGGAVEGLAQAPRGGGGGGGRAAPTATPGYGSSPRRGSGSRKRSPTSSATPTASSSTRPARGVRRRSCGRWRCSRPSARPTFPASRRRWRAISP